MIENLILLAKAGIISIRCRQLKQTAIHEAKLKLFWDGGEIYHGNLPDGVREHH